MTYTAVSKVFFIDRYLDRLKTRTIPLAAFRGLFPFLLPQLDPLIPPA
jgi:hypothetical protein